MHPVYQTKWAKFGLTALGLPDNYSVPQNEDSYATLFWWAYKDLDIKNQPTSRADDYPYLQWASNHYIRKKQGLISNQDYPLTWEAKASAAQYRGIANLNAKYFKSKVPVFFRGDSTLLDENKGITFKKLASRLLLTNHFIK